MRFQVTVTLGNAAMCTRSDLADMLARIAERMRADAESGDEIGVVRDINGNRVGEWILGDWTEGEEDK